MNEATFSELLQDTRKTKRVSLRQMAVQIGVTPSYLSDIENDRRIPSEEVMHKIATAYELNFDGLMCLAGRLGEEAERYIKKRPEVIGLMRMCMKYNLGREELVELQVKVAQMAPLVPTEAQP